MTGPEVTAMAVATFILGLLIGLLAGSIDKRP